MDNTLANLLGESGLSDEIIAALQEAFDAKVASVREDAELAIREEFAARFEHDKNNLVSAMDLLLSEAVTKVETERAAEIAKLVETRGRYETAVKEARAAYKKKIAEHVDRTGTFVVDNLAKTIKALAEQKKLLVARQKKLDEQFETVKADVAEQNAARLQQIDEFVIRQVTRELKEFKQDRDALVEQRVRLVAEHKSKLAETQKKFVKESAAKVETFVATAVKHEMTQLHEDVEANRQNAFGRRIFEAVAAEFMTSYLAEGTEIRKLQNVLESKDAELSAANNKLNEAARTLDGVTRKVKLAEDRAARTKIMNELLAPLRGDKKSVMTTMLESTKTEHLRTAFDRLLPVVLNETTRKPVAPAAAKRDVLAETKAPTTRRVVVTGDKSRLVEGAQSETQAEMDAHIAQVVRLAGIKN